MSILLKSQPSKIYRFLVLQWLYNTVLVLVEYYRTKEQCAVSSDLIYNCSIINEVHFKMDGTRTRKPLDLWFMVVKQLTM